MNKIIFTEDAPNPIGPYCQAVLVGDTLYCSGQISLNPKSGELVSGGIIPETEMVCQNIKAVLAAAGLDFKNVVKTTCFLTDMKNFPEFNEVYAKYFISNPARSTVAVKELPKGVLVEIEVIAVLTTI